MTTFGTMGKVLNEFAQPLEYGLGPDVSVTVEGPWRNPRTDDGVYSWDVSYEFSLRGRATAKINVTDMQGASPDAAIKLVADEMSRVRDELWETIEPVRSAWYKEHDPYA